MNFCGHGIFSIYSLGIINLILILFVWFKAEEYGMDPFVWVIAVFFFGPLAFGVFLFLVLSQTRVRGKQASGYPPAGYRSKNDYIPDEPSRETSAVNPDFRDDHLDDLITDGEFGKARAYMREMIQVARDTQDEGAVRNYSQYSPRINNAAMEAEKRKKKDSGGGFLSD